MMLKLTTRPPITASDRARRALGILALAGVPALSGGLALSGALAPATSTTGRTGRMHGEMPARNPATMPTTISPTMPPPLYRQIQPPQFVIRSRHGLRIGRPARRAETASGRRDGQDEGPAEGEQRTQVAVALIPDPVGQVAAQVVSKAVMHGPPAA
jgi:hypothetical protein